MKVLWFSPTPSNYNPENTKSSSGRWISGLENQIVKYPEIDLYIAFHSNGVEKIIYHKKNNVTYILIPGEVKENKIKRIILRWKGETYSKYFYHYHMEVINEVNPDLIQIFGFEHPFGLISRKIRTPILIHIQGILNVYKEFYYAGFLKTDLIFNEKFKDIILGRGYLHNYTRLLKKANEEEEIIKNIKFFIGRTDFDRRIVKVINSNGTYFLNNEILNEIFYASVWSKTSFNKTIKLYSTTGPSLYKGSDTIIKCAKILKEIGFKFEWNIAGLEVDTPFFNFLLKKFDNITESNINFLGKLDTESIIKNLLNADIFINTSHIENSSNAIQEAQLIGIPIIASNVGGTPSLISDKEDGLLFQSGDYLSLTGAIIELSENFEYAKELGRKAREKALRRNDPETVGKRTIEIYKNVLEHSDKKF